LHLWLASESNKDPHSLLFPWWGIDYIAWCCLGCFHLHHKRHVVSCFTWTNSWPSITLLSMFLLTSLHYVISGWHSHFVQHVNCLALEKSILTLFATLISNKQGFLAIISSSNYNNLQNLIVEQDSFAKASHNKCGLFWLPCKNFAQQMRLCSKVDDEIVTKEITFPTQASTFELQMWM
jgi:hypothetical protein